MKVFQIGFNKCAASALQSMFLKSGVRALHGPGRYWRLNGHPAVTGRNVQLVIHRNIAAGRPALESLEDFDAFFDMEFSQHGWNIENYREFGTLAQDYPDARFILNTREKAAWLHSRARHNDGLYLKHAMDRTGLGRRGVLDYWADDFDRHHEMVQDYFRDRPDRLLVFDIDTTPIRRLKRFVGPEIDLKPRHWKPARTPDEAAEAKAGKSTEQAADSTERNARAA